MRHRSRQSVGKSIFNRFLNVYTQVHYSGALAVKRYFKFSVLGNVRIWCKLLCITSVSLLKIYENDFLVTAIAYSLACPALNWCNDSVHRKINISNDLS